MPDPKPYRFVAVYTQDSPFGAVRSVYECSSEAMADVLAHIVNRLTEDSADTTQGPYSDETVESAGPFLAALFKKISDGVKQ